MGPDQTTLEEARKVIRNYNLAERLPHSVVEYLMKVGQEGETPKAFPQNTYFLLNTLPDSCIYAKQIAQEMGLSAVILTSYLEGESKDAGTVFASIAREIQNYGNPVNAPCVILSSGETTTKILSNKEIMPFAGTKTMNTFQDGTFAGAFGGVTTLIDFAQQIGGTSLHQSLRDRLEEAEGRCYVDYGFHITLTDTSPETLAEIPDLCSEGFTSFKLHTTYKAGGLYIDTKGLEKCFAAVAKAGGLVTVHEQHQYGQSARNPQSRPDQQAKGKGKRAAIHKSLEYYHTFGRTEGNVPLWRKPAEGCYFKVVDDRRGYIYNG